MEAPLLTKKRKIKILYLYPALHIGGAEQLRLTSLRHINREKYDIRLCCFTEKGRIGREIEDLGFKVDVMRTSYRLINILSLFPILSYLRRNKFDIVHTSLPVANLYGRIAALAIKIPCIISEEVSYYERYNPYLGFLFRTINKILSRHTYKIIACCDMVKETIAREEGIQEEKFLTIYPPIDSERFMTASSRKESRVKLGLHLETPIIGCMASLMSRKGYIYLLRAMRPILGSYPEAKLLIIGDGPLRKQLEEFVGQNHLTNCVQFLGFRRDTPSIFKAIDVFVSPSIKEALGVNLIEAMYSGLPCVVTSVGGTPELVINGKTGILVPPANPEALAKAIINLLGNRELSEKYGEAGRRRILEHFTVDKYIKKLESLYDEAIFGEVKTGTVD